MFCPNCSAETKDTEQKFCKSCGTNIQLVAESLSRGQVSLETYKFDFDAMRNNLTEIGRNIKASIQKAANKDEGHINTRELELKKSLLMCSRTRNLQRAVINVLSSVGTGIFLNYLGQTAVASGTIRSIEEVAHLSGLEPIARIIWLVSVIPFCAGIGYLINGIFFSRKPDISIGPAPASTTKQTTNPIEPPTSVTENTTAFLYNDNPKSI
jgi:hypothetical protein